jgi:alcohol dehydrogenase class IV
MGNKAKMIAIPTTSGTGSETTFATVISKLEENIWKKYLYIHRGLIPTYAIVDPIFPSGMPPELTINTAFDALSHSIEGLGNFWKNEFSNAVALKAIELIFKYLPVAVKDGSNIEARDYLHQASTLAGLAFGNSNAHIGHSLGHSWGAMFHVPHGRCVGIVLKYIVQFILINHERVEEVIQIFVKLSKQLGWVNWDETDQKAAYKVVEKIVELQKEVKFPLTLKETGVTRVDLEKNMDSLITLTFQDATAAMSPRSPSAEDFKKLYYYSFDGKDIDF